MPGFEIDSHDAQESNVRNNEVVNTINKKTDEELKKLIEITLKKYYEEEVIWIFIKFLYFKRSLKHGPKNNSHGFERLKDFSDFNEIKQHLIKSLIKIEPQEKIRK